MNSYSLVRKCIACLIAGITLFIFILAYNSVKKSQLIFNFKCHGNLCKAPLGNRRA